MTHQELLEAYERQSRVAIHERSSDCLRDMLRLWDEVVSHAAEHGLDDEFAVTERDEHLASMGFGRNEDGTFYDLIDGEAVRL